MNTTITSVGDGSAWNNTLPYVFLITDGAQDPQVKALNGGGWSGSRLGGRPPVSARVGFNGRFS